MADDRIPQILPRAARAAVAPISIERAAFDRGMVDIRFAVSHADEKAGLYYLRELRQQLRLLATLHGFPME